jgi:predicted MFS family arabinose efflux permease
MFPVWLAGPVILLLVVGVAGNYTLAGQGLSIIAATRQWSVPELTGVALALWGFGSLIGGVAYGMMRRPPRALALLAMLAASAFVVMVAPNHATFVVLITLSGLFSAPVVIAASDELSRLVPASARGEAMSWHGSATITGNALGSPMAGLGLDAAGWPGGMFIAAAGGMLVAAVGAIIHRRARRARM